MHVYLYLLPVDDTLRILILIFHEVEISLSIIYPITDSKNSQCLFVTLYVCWTIYTFSCMTVFLLQLEENIRTIALSGDWVKLVDDCSTEPSVFQSAATAAGSTQKRRPGRRGRKPSATAEVAIDSQDSLSDFTWWRGGTLSKRIFQRGILPRSMVKKAARQGNIDTPSFSCSVEKKLNA